MVAQMSSLSSTCRLRAAARSVRRRRAWRGSSCSPMPTFKSTIEADFENASNVVRERLAADEAARADAERQRRALEQEQADRAAVVRARRSAERRRHHRPRRAGARRVGRHAGDARGVGRGARSPLRRSVPRRREALRAAPAREAIRRTVADARARDRGARREPVVQRHSQPVVFAAQAVAGDRARRRDRCRAAAPVTTPPRRSSKRRSRRIATPRASSRSRTCSGCRRWCRSSRPAPPPRASRSSRPIS